MAYIPKYAVGYTFNYPTWFGEPVEIVDTELVERLKTYQYRIEYHSTGHQLWLKESEIDKCLENQVSPYHKWMRFLHALAERMTELDPELSWHVTRLKDEGEAVIKSIGDDRGVCVYRVDDNFMAHGLYPLLDMEPITSQGVGLPWLDAKLSDGPGKIAELLMGGFMKRHETLLNLIKIYQEDE